MLNTLKRTLSETALVLLLALALCLLVTAMRPQGLGLFRRLPEANDLSSEESAGHVIPLADAIERFEEGGTLFVDARSAEDYAAGHIRGARSLPLSQFDERIAAFLAETALETPVITYCEGSNCHLAPELADRLVLLGFKTVFFLEDGWGQWQANGLPGVKGMDRQSHRSKGLYPQRPDPVRLGRSPTRGRVSKFCRG